jgi:hypothetical protein
LVNTHVQNETKKSLCREKQGLEILKSILEAKYVVDRECKRFDPWLLAAKIWPIPKSTN